MDISIGINNSPREINFESTQSSTEVESIIAEALNSDAKYVSLRDAKGKLFIVPISALAYVELGDEESRRVGFVV